YKAVAGQAYIAYMSLRDDLPIALRKSGRDAHGCDADALFRFLVEAERPAAARQRGQEFHSLDDAANQGDVAVELTRRLPDHHVQLRTITAVGRIAAADS